VKYFSYLTTIVSKLGETRDAGPLDELVVMEQSRGRFTFDNVEEAARKLGFGPEGDLRLDYDDDIDDQFIEEAWKDVIKRSWRDPENCAEIARTANEAFRILAEARGSVRLMKAWENGKNKMNPEQAYNTLEVPKETDDAMLITVFGLRVSLLAFYSQA